MLSCPQLFLSAFQGFVVLPRFPPGLRPGLHSAATSWLGLRRGVNSSVRARSFVIYIVDASLSNSDGSSHSFRFAISPDQASRIRGLRRSPLRLCRRPVAFVQNQ